MRFLVGTLTVLVLAAAPHHGQGAVVSGNVNLRAGPSCDSLRIRTLCPAADAEAAGSHVPSARPCRPPRTGCARLLVADSPPGSGREP